MALTTPILISTSSFGAYYLFGFSTLLCTIVCAIYMVETKGHSLEVNEQRYLESRATTTGRWTVKGFKLRRARDINESGGSCVPRTETLALR